MALSRPYSALQTEAGFALGTTLGDLVRGAGSLACQVLNANANWSNPTFPFFPAYAQGLFNSLCGGTEPPPPSLPFTGGQCAGQFYTVVATQADGNPPTLQPTPPIGFTAPLYGVFPRKETNGNWTYLLKWSNGETSLGSAPKDTWDAIGIPSVISVTRGGGLPDDCGNPPPQYPPTVPDPGDLSIVAPVFVSPTLTITPVFVYVRPELNLNLDFPVTIDVDPVIQLPDLNIEIKFGPDNFTIQPYQPPSQPRLPPPADPRPNPPSPSKPPPVQADCPDYSDRFDAIDEQLDDIEDCACEDDYTTSTQVLGGGDSGVFSLPSRAFAVSLLLTQIPSNAKMEAGNNAPDVYYGGWASFIDSSNSLSERIPIAYDRNWYRVPDGSSKFSFTCRAGYLATAVAYYKVPV